MLAFTRTLAAAVESRAISLSTSTARSAASSRAINFVCSSIFFSFTKTGMLQPIVSMSTVFLSGSVALNEH